MNDAFGEVNVLVGTQGACIALGRSRATLRATGTAPDAAQRSQP